MKVSRIIIYVFVSFFLISCSKEGDTIEVNFLENYDGSVWKANNDFNDEYDFLKFINDNNFNFKIYEKLNYENEEDDCYATQMDGSYIVIRKNSNDTFQFEEIWTTIYGYTNTYLTIITVDGNILTWENKWKSSLGGDWSSVTHQKTYQRYSENFDNLPLCEWEN